MKIKLIILIGITVLFHFKISAQNFYAIDTIQKIEIFFAQSNWDYILDTAKQGSDSYTLALGVDINGLYFDSVGVKYKGNSSYNPGNAKNPLHIELDHFKNQDYKGYKDIKLSNGYHEPSLVREVMLYSILQNYMKASVANYTKVYINSQYMGLYTNVEAVTNTFLDDRFYSNNNTFVFADNVGCNLRYKGNDSTIYYFPYTMKSDYGWADLMHLCDTLEHNVNGIENILDVDRALWMLAFTNSLVTLDSYIGNAAHNYYLYEDHNGIFNPVIWDLNGGLGVFNKPYFGTELTVSQMQTMSPMLHGNDSLWPLVKNILAVPMYKRMYIAHMKTIMNEHIANSSYYTYAQYLQTIIDSVVQSDPNAFYTYSEFQSNLTTTIIDGTKTIPGITELMDARLIYLNSTTEFQQIPPTISNVQPSDTFPLINSVINITADIINATNVFIGTRNSIMEKFIRMIMYDDGIHGDGAAGDGTFGISLPVTSSEIQYYIYAENGNAGIFFPQRAENEYYNISANYTTITAGQVVINEIMAINNSTVQNNNGNYGDWVELYNNSSNTVLLDYLNLSDDASNPVKWQFPSGTSIPPDGFLIVWVDNDTSSTELHCDFKFSGNGEHAVIAYSNAVIIDSISFPAQTADISWGRYPNGTGTFIFMPPTFYAVNSTSGIEETVNGYNSVLIYPNPAAKSATMEILNSGTLNDRLSICDLLGNIVIEKVLAAKVDIVNFDLPDGIYFYKVYNDQMIIGKGKIIIQNK